ncbi:MAG: thiol:disulfide interchange protein DsbA/DsbL, partial [Pseudomonadota bacterium]
MISRLALLLVVLLPLAACKPDTAATANGDATTPAAEGAPAAAAPQASAEDPQAKAAAEAAAQAAAEAAAKLPPPVAGTDYIEIANGQPLETTDGRIEVVEFFGYVCPYCAAFQPTVRALKANLP